MAISFHDCYLTAAILMLGLYFIWNQCNYNSLCLFELFAVIADGVGRLIQARADSLEMAIIACKIQYVGALLIPLIWVLLLARLCGIRLPKGLTWGLIAATVIIFGSALTIGYGPSYYKSVSLDVSGRHSYLIKEYGPMHGAYIALMLVYLVTIAVLAVCAIRKRRSVPYKAIFFACCAGCLTIVLYIIEKLLNITLEWKPLVYILTGMPILIASDTLNMFDMSVCIASAVDKMNDYGYIVFDRKCRFISTNQFARNLFPEIQHWNIEHSVPAENTNAYHYIASQLTSSTSEDENGSVLEIGGRYIEITFRFMYHRHKRPVGYLIELMDKTNEYRHIHTVQEYNALLEKQIAKTEAANQAAEISREEADQANRSKSDFLSRMSHDILTPINSIFGMLRIIEANLDDKETVHSGLKNIKAASQQLSLLLNDVLDMSCLENGTIQLDQEPFDLAQLLSVCVPSIQVLEEAKGITIQPPQIVCTNQMVIGNPMYVQQIVMNVLTHSLKYNRPNGTVCLSCRETSIDRNRSLFEIVVQDTGIGMSQEFLNRIFNPFERKPSTDGAANEGVGLEMAIAKKLVEMMGGTIAIERNLGAGTTVTVRLPMEICREERKEARAPAGMLSGTRALVAEDNPMNQEYISFVLKEHGILVDVVSDGKKAVDRILCAEADPYDFIFMDIMMPQMDGFEAARAIRALPGRYPKIVPIIAMTANSFKEDIQSCLDAGMNDHIAKPLDIEELEAKLVKYRYTKSTGLVQEV